MCIRDSSTIAGIAAVYLPEYYEAETAIAARIRAMAQHPPAPLPDAERVLQEMCIRDRVYGI